MWLLDLWIVSSPNSPCSCPGSLLKQLREPPGAPSLILERHPNSDFDRASCAPTRNDIHHPGWRKRILRTFIFFLSYRKEREKKTYSYGEKKGKGYKQPVQKRIIVNKWKDNNVPFHRRTAQVNNNEISLTFRQRWKLVLRVGEYCKLIFKDLSGVFFGKRYQNS